MTTRPANGQFANSPVAGYHWRNFRFAHCWAYVRRTFVEVEFRDPGPCGEVLERMGRLSAMKQACPGVAATASEEGRATPPPFRAAAWREQWIAIVDAIHAWRECVRKNGHP